jgi:peroxiredoxin Q/BCP
MLPVELDLELLQPGDVAPDFSLPSHTGDTYSLSAYRGSYVIVWWYIQAMGAGCSACANAFSSETSRIVSLNASLLGLSYSTPAQNTQFAISTGFASPLLTADEALAKSYGAQRSEQEQWAGLPRRIAYIINPQGLVEERYVIAGSSHLAVTAIVDDLEKLVSDKSPLQEPTWGEQPHEMNLANRVLHVIRGSFTAKA